MRCKLEKSILLLSIEGVISKQRGGKAGKVPVKVEYDLITRWGTPGHATRRAWVLPQNALKEGHKLDVEQMELHGLKLPEPDDMHRVHRHIWDSGAEKDHLVSDQHYVQQAQAAHSEEVDEYRTNYIQNAGVEPDDPKRMHSHKGAPDKHLASKQHEDIDADIEHREEVAEYERVFSRRQEGETPWLDKFNVRVIIDRSIRVGDESVKATEYKIPRIKNPIYVFDKWPHVYLYVHGSGYKTFDKEYEALAFVKDLCEMAEGKKRSLTRLPQMRKTLLGKIEELAGTRVVKSMTTYSSLQIGDVTVSLESDNDDYKVSVNDIPLLTTDSFRDAIGKFYSEIAKIIAAKNENRDVALEIFGEKVIGVNRDVMEKLASLGKNKEKQWLLNLDFNWLEKYEPVGSVFGIVPVPEEMGHGAAEGGKVPRRIDLRPEDFKIRPKTEVLQYPIEAVENMGKNPIAPAGDQVRKDGYTFVKPEENLPGEEMVVANVASSKAKSRMKHPIEQSAINPSGDGKAQPFVQKDFPKQAEGGWIGELKENIENLEKLGSKPRPIVGKSFSTMSPKERIGDKLGPIEGDKQFDERTVI